MKQEAQEQRASSRVESSSPDAAAFGPGGRVRWMLAALAVALVAGGLAFQQSPRPDPFRSPSLVERFAYPIEWNASRRLDAVPGRINAVFGRADVHRFWAAGDGGLLLSSGDLGRSWRQDSIVLDSTATTVTAGSRPADSAEASQSPVQQQVPDSASPRQSANQRQTRLPGKPDARQASTAQSTIPPVGGRVRWDFIALDFADDSVGIVVAREGALLTRDGGRTWRVAFDARLRAPLRTGHLIARTTGWLWDERGQVWSTTSGGAIWEPSSESAPRLARLHFSSAMNGAGIHYDRTLWVTDNGGREWRLLPRRDRLGLAEALFTDSLAAAAIDTSGVLLTGREAGAVWDTVPAMVQRLSAIAFRTDVMLGVSRDGRQLLRQEGTNRGASDWHVVLGRPAIARLSFIDGRSGWLATEDGEVLRTDDGAESWTPVGHLGGAPRSLRFARVDDGLAVLAAPELSENVRVWRSVDGGRNWFALVGTSVLTGNLQLPREASPPPRCTRDGRCFDGVWSEADSQHYWYGSQGVLYRGLREPPNEAAEAVDPAGSALHIRVLSFTPGLGHGFGGSADGIVYTTTDTGRTWQDPAPYGRWPAPWYFLTWIVVGVLVARGLAPPPPPPPVKSVADVLVSDSPIQRGEPDAIGLGRIAAGLAGFLRNSKTKPPLTIAVTGEWGTGKSSLMNLLQAELVGVGYRAVWFNAWHHQKEEHLLAALLEAVQREAVPPFLSWDGLEFRARLLRLRTARYQRLVFVLVPVFALSIGYLTSHGAATWERFAALGDWFGNLVENPAKAELKPGLLTGVAFSILSILGTAAGPIVTWMKGLKAFGATPASLMASMQGAFKLRDIQAQTGFRHQFVADFSEVTRALGDRYLLIVIDDLDRCQPDNVVEVLEAISFLVSAGDCVIVLGMDRKYVDACVGLRFQVVAKELSGQAAEDEAAAREVRRDFARHYLQKLVNVEVPVPIATERQLRDVILPPSPTPIEHPRLEQVARGLARMAVAALVVLLGAGAFVVGRGRSPAPVPAAGGRASGIPATPASMAGSNVFAPASLGVAGPLDGDTSAVDVVPGATTSTSRLILWLGLVAIVAAAVISLLRRPIPRIEDSQEFAAALDRWTPLVYLRSKTPREMKRFLNRVRLYSMQQHPPRAADTLATQITQLLGRWFGRLGRKEPAPTPAQPTPSGPAIDEPDLVALTAIDTYKPELLDLLGKRGVLAMDDLPPDIRKLLTERREELASAVPAYRTQARGLRVD